MIQLSNVVLPPDTDFSDLAQLLARVTGLQKNQLQNCRLIKRSVDARKKPDVVLVCTFVFETQGEEKAIKRIKHKQTTLVSQKQNDLWVKT